MIKLYLKQNEIDSNMLDLSQDTLSGRIMLAIVPIDILWQDKAMYKQIHTGETIEIIANLTGNY